MDKDKQQLIEEAKLVRKLANDLIERLEAEAEKPKLRHGDYGICEKGKELYGFTYYKSVNGAGYFLTHLTKQVYHGCWPKVDRVVFVGGNLDDLKAIAGPLTECEAGGIVFKMDSVGRLAVIRDGWWQAEILAKDIPIFILNLRRLLRTAEQAKHE
jgi:hypothetical protein